ncbi:MAG TPA: amidohydrolase family protein [Bryobacteraceae bacterium]|nr:amidohydrolase family protein [Bryobacteraceae bacterium]
MRLLLPLIMVSTLAAQQYDLVLANGHVMDPASGLDAARNLGIRDGKIAAVSSRALQGKQVVDVKGLVVAPGFIDLHSHGQTPENYRFKARDGVTTALEMEVGVSPVSAWYAEREGHAAINFGATVGHIPARMAVLHDTGTFLPRDKATGPANAGQRAEVLQLLGRGLDEGALGIGMGIAYVTEATRAEIYEVFRFAAGRKATLYVHMRNSGPVEPGAIDSLQEVLADAAGSGASLHIVHITSTALREAALALEMIAGAQKRGLDVTTEAYPYTAGMTDISSAIFADGWQARSGGISYGDLQWALTGERLTAESFARYRKQGGMVAIHSIPEEVVRTAMSNPMVMIASDGILQEGKGHPRAAGTYARVLGRYVREQHTMTLMDALRKMTVMPAARLGLKSKGRIAIGADADITVFDPEKVIDRATFDQPAQYSEGIPYVLVNGVLVVKNGRTEEGSLPGRPVRR